MCSGICKHCPREGSAMGRKSREHRERRLDRSARLEKDLRRLADEDASFWSSRNCPEDLRETNLEDILAFESVGKGTSLFDGLQEHGIELPHPDKLDEEQSAKKVDEVVHALEELKIFLIGIQDMCACKLYRTLWNQTLWEGNYVKKRIPGAFTMIDVSHSIPQSEILEFLEEAAKASSVQ